MELSPRARAAVLIDSNSSLSASPSIRLSTGFGCLGALDLRSELVSKECCMFCEGLDPLRHSRLSACPRVRATARLLAGSPSLWLTCVCWSEGGGGMRAVVTRRWI